MAVIKKRIIKLFVLLIVMLMIGLLSIMVLKKTNNSTECHIKNFYREPENTIDVALIGCSELYADYSPPIAYREAGFTSYNLCYEGAPSCFYSSMLREYLRKQDPQLVTFEINAFIYSEEYCTREGNLRKWLDNIERTDNWYDTIQQFVKPEDRINYYLRINKYHTNWQWVREQGGRLKALYMNSKGDVSMMKSFSTRTSRNSKVKVKRKDSPAMSRYGRQQLEATLKYCKECGLEDVMFFRAPHKEKMSQESCDEIKELVESYGYDFVNFEDQISDIGIDEENDYYNVDHLNVYGNEKFTKYLANYISSNYEITIDHLEDIDKTWNECADYTEKAFAKLKVKTDANEDKAYFEYSNYDI